MAGVMSDNFAFLLAACMSFSYGTSKHAELVAINDE